MITLYGTRPGRQRSVRLWLVAALTILVTLLTACSAAGDPEPSKEHPLPTRDPVEASTALTTFAEQLHQQIAPAGKFAEVGVSNSPCEDPQGNATEDGPYAKIGNYQIFLPAEQHRPVLTRLSHEWKAAGWTGITYSAFGSDGVSAELKGTRPGDRFSVTVTSGTPPIGFAVLLSTPCYERPE